jgi:hypothetical protein
MRNEMESDRIQAEIDKSRGSGWGTIFNTIVDAAAKKIFHVG